MLVEYSYTRAASCNSSLLKFKLGFPRVLCLRLEAHIDTVVYE